MAGNYTLGRRRPLLDRHASMITVKLNPSDITLGIKMRHRSWTMRRVQYEESRAEATL